jgi:hypothetical protein
MDATVRRAWLLAFCVAVVLAPVAAWAQPLITADAGLYEVMESMTLGGSGNVIRRATASLTGWVKGGTPICPSSLGLAFCTVNVIASDTVRIDTGKGTVSGDFSVVVPCPPFCNKGDNPVDGPEITVLSGTLRGDIDLGPAYLQGIPIGNFTGSLQGSGTKGGPLDRLIVRGSFTGTFRLPFVFPDDPQFPPSYVIDPAKWPSPESYRSVLYPKEYLFAGGPDVPRSYPMVLLELTFK